MIFSSPEWQENPSEDQDPHQPSSSKDHQNGFDSNHQKPMNSQQISNYEAVTSLVDSTNGIAANINDALLNFMNKTRKKKGSSAFKVPLQVSIPNFEYELLRSLLRHCFFGAIFF